MAKLVDAPHSKCGGFGHVGSSPTLPITVSLDSLRILIPNLTFTRRKAFVAVAFAYLLVGVIQYNKLLG